jgi:predicted amidohydrolase
MIFVLTRSALFVNVNPVRVGLIQYEPRFGEVAANMEKVSGMVSEVDADIVVLPELCFTGYTFTSREEARALAENPADGFISKQIRSLSAKLDRGVIYGFAELDGDRLYNSCAFVRPDGRLDIYRKLHLYYYEKEWFDPGDKQLEIIEFRGCRVGMMICFDWFFPEVTRTLALQGAHLICHPSNLVMSYCQNSMITRCLENSVFAVTANRTGREKRGRFDFAFSGASQIVSNKGEILYRASIDKDAIGIADIDFRASEDKAVNSKNDLWLDRRPGFYRMG